VAKKKKTPFARPTWSLRIAATGVFLAQIVVLPGAASPFRLPKEALTLAALAIAIAIAVAAAARRRRIALPAGRLAAVLAAYPVLLAVSVIWSADPLRSLQAAAVTAIWLSGLFWLSTVDNADRQRLHLAAAVGVSFSIAVLILQIVGVQTFNFGAQTTGRMRLTGLTGNPADLAMAAVLVLPLLLADSQRMSRSRWWRGLVVLLASSVVMTRTLTGVAALAAVAAVWLWQQRSKRVWIAVGATALLLAVGAATTGLGSRIVDQADRLRRGEWYALLSARADGWTAATEMIRSHPGTGVGGANFTVAYYPSRIDWLQRNGGTGGRGEIASHFERAHNDPIQLQAELGIFGTAWAIALAVTIFGTRRRSSPLLALAAGAWTPFALLHYPSHLAVGLIPTSLVLAHLVRAEREPVEREWRRWRRPIAIAAAILAVVIAWWQLQRVAVNLWMGSNDVRLQVLEQAPPEVRARHARGIENQIVARIDRLPLQAPALWRTVGRARILQNDLNGAAQAFAAAHELWPHEDSEFYLGLTLAATGKRTEALQRLGRVCRTNPALIQLINDPGLRRAVEDIIESYSR
jgi:O-antigen ligase